MDYILSNIDEFNRLGILFIPNPPKIYGEWASVSEYDNKITNHFITSLNLIQNNLPIFSELTIILKKMWTDNMEKDCQFNINDWYTVECGNGSNIKTIEEFQNFYKDRIRTVKTNFAKFVEKVEKEIVDKNLRTLNIEERQISY